MAVADTRRGRTTSSTREGLHETLHRIRSGVRRQRRGCHGAGARSVERRRQPAVGHRDGLSPVGIDRRCSRSVRRRIHPRQSGDGQRGQQLGDTLDVETTVETAIVYSAVIDATNVDTAERDATADDTSNDDATDNHATDNNTANFNSSDLDAANLDASDLHAAERSAECSGRNVGNAESTKHSTDGW
jgi:hypothetical protein